MKRTLDPLKLSNSPLVLVLCQIRFSPVMVMEKYIPGIQDIFRLNGYPHIKRNIIHETIFTPAGPETVKKLRWIVHSKNLANSVIITDNFMVFQTTSYSVFEDFIDQLKTIIKTIADEVKGLYIQRIGLRYVDLIREDSETSWRDFLRPELSGLKSDVFKNGSQIQLHQSIAETKTGTMIIRLLQNREGHYLPPDLTDDELKIIRKDHHNFDPSELLTILDLDHFAVQKFDFRLSQITEILWELHDCLDVIFRNSIVTSKALEKWE